jgi:tetratricopeptide (TPR) repeat protein
MIDDLFLLVGAVGELGLSAALPKLATSTGDPPELVEVYENACAAIEENPDDVQAHFTRGVICQGKRCYEAALADFATVVHLEPQHARAWLLAGEVLHALGKYEQSQAARQQALAIDPMVG